MDTHASSLKKPHTRDASFLNKLFRQNEPASGMVKIRLSVPRARCSLGSGRV